jgi:hypothetical protein
VADQLEPIKRRVALKLIKPGMDSRSVLGRFEAVGQRNAAPEAIVPFFVLNLAYTPATAVQILRSFR